jgi:hypothetical protein
VKKDDPAALQVWFELLHGCLNKIDPEAKISTTWNVLVIARKYG